MKLNNPAAVKEKPVQTGRVEKKRASARNANKKVAYNMLNEPLGAMKDFTDLMKLEKRPKAGLVGNKRTSARNANEKVAYNTLSDPLSGHLRGFCSCYQSRNLSTFTKVPGKSEKAVGANGRGERWAKNKQI